MRSTKLILVLAIAVGAAAIIAGCGRRGASTSSGSSNKSVQIKGSDTMVNLGSAWAEAYMNKHPEANVMVTGGGSGTGIAAMIDGNTDIAEASRAMKPEEIKQAEARGVTPVEHVTGMDALSVIVNPANSVNKLTINQLSDIFTGKITNWKDVGGPNEKIIVLSRDKSSGSHVFFLEHVLRKGKEKGPQEYAKSALMLPANEAIASQVARDKATIGYVGLGFVKPGKEKALAVAKTAEGPYVEPSVETAIDGTYPVARPLYWYTKGEPAGEVKSLLDFVMSPDGQKIVEELGFAPVTSKKA